MEYSCGVIPLKKNEKGGWEVLIIQHHAGHWGFPKGHAEEGETALQTATRELEEETGLGIVQLLSVESLEEVYYPVKNGKQIEKRVTYFLALVEGKVTIQQEELKDFRWVPIEQVEGCVTHEGTKALCRAIFKSTIFA